MREEVMLTLFAKPVVEQIRSELKSRIDAIRDRRGTPPKLAVVLVGEDPASVIYTRQKGEQAVALGMDHITLKLPQTATPEAVRAEVQRLNEDQSIDGILIQRPLPRSFREEDVVYWVHPSKDVDAFHPENTGRLVLGLPCFQPCTPAGIMKLLKHYQIETAGKIACVIGRSSIVGKPMAALLTQADATVFHCNSKTKNLAEISRQADIVIVAAGKPGMVNASHVREGAVVIDVGIHKTAQGKTVGDVVFDDAAKKASALSPVPGGVGPMTIAMLLTNTVMAAESRLK